MITDEQVADLRPGMQVEVYHPNHPEVITRGRLRIYCTGTSALGLGDLALTDFSNRVHRHVRNLNLRVIQ